MTGGQMAAIVIAVVVCVALFAAITRAILKNSKGSVRDGVKRLGDPVGTSVQDWQRAMRRNPDALSDNGDGTHALQWQCTGQHIVVLFGADQRLIGIPHRYHC